MTERVRTPLVLGAGLDRATGVMAVDPRSLREATNVYLLGGKAQARKGMTAREAYNDDAGRPVSHVLAVQALRQHGTLVVVGYSQATGAVWVYRCQASGVVAARFAQPWFTLTPGSPPPVIVTAALDDKVFMAHDEPLPGVRAPTVYCSPTLAATDPLPHLLYPEVVPEGGTPKNEPMKFRGVAVHLNYLVGWGFGTPELDRPEFVRVSKPASPLEWDADDYWIVGMIGDPVTAVASIDNNLVAFKLTQTYQLFGENARNFGSKPYPTEATYGCVGSRMAVVHNGRCFFWSLSGPRVTLGTGPSEDVGVPLDLLGPAPQALVQAGQARMAFGIHHPNESVLLWIFGRRGYCLSLVEGEGLRWSYLELGQEVYCAGHAYAFAEGTGGGVDPGEGTPGGGPVGGEAAVVPLRLDAALQYGALGLVIENRYTLGTDFVNVWYKVEGGEWREGPTVGSSAGQQQTIPLPGLTPGASYTVAARLKRGEVYPLTHQGSPDGWPAWARTTGKVCAAPTALATAWSYDPASHIGSLIASATPSVAAVPLEYARRASPGDAFAPVSATEPTPHGGTWAYQARHRFRDAAGVLTYSPWFPAAPTLEHFAGPREVPVLLTAISPALGSLAVTLEPCASAVALFYYGPNPITGQGLSGWFPLGEVDLTLPDGVRPALLAPGATTASFAVPYLAGKAVQVQAFAAAVPAIPSLATPYLYGAGSNTLAVTILGSDGPPPEPDPEFWIAAGSRTQEQTNCTVEDYLSWSSGGFEASLHRIQYRLTNRAGAPTSGWATLGAAAGGEILMNQHEGKLDTRLIGDGEHVAYGVEVRLSEKASGHLLVSAEVEFYDYWLVPCSGGPGPEPEPDLGLDAGGAPRAGSGCSVEGVLAWSASNLQARHRVQVRLPGGAWADVGAEGELVIDSRAGVLDASGPTRVQYTAGVRIVDRGEGLEGGTVVLEREVPYDYRTRPCPLPLGITASAEPQERSGCVIEDYLSWGASGFDGAKHRVEYRVGSGGWGGAGGASGSVLVDSRGGKLDTVVTGGAGTHVSYAASVRVVLRSSGAVLVEDTAHFDYWTLPCDGGGGGGGGDDDTEIIPGGGG